MAGLVTTAFAAANRFGAAVASGVAHVYGSAFPSSKVHKIAGLRVYSGLPKWAYPRGGVCVGNVFLTGAEPSKVLVAHELVHARQWKRYGLVFPLLYAAAGANPLTNRFEVEAGLKSGGYVRADGTPYSPKRKRRGGRRLDASQPRGNV